MTAVLTKLKVPTVDLQDLVLRASKGSSNVDVIPLTCLMEIKVKDGQLSVKTTDNSTYLTTYDIMKKDDSNPLPDFHATVDSRLFTGIISKLQKDYTTLTIEDKKLVVEANGVYNVALVTEDNGAMVCFPDISFEPNGSSNHLTAAEVRSILALNKSCKSEQKDVPTLYNYYFDSERVLTTNQYKACINPVKFSDRPMCLSPSVLELITSVLDEDGGVDVCQDDTNVMFYSNKGTVIGKKASQADLDKYPAEDLIGLLDVQVDNKASTLRTMLYQAVERVSLFVDAFSSYKLDITFTNESIELRSETTGSFEKVPYKDTDKYTGEPVHISIGADFLKTQLAACSAEVIELKFSEEIGLILKCGDVHLVLGVLDQE